MSEKHTCCGSVYSLGFGFPCGKTAKFERDGKHYCGIHDPVACKAKDDAKRAKRNAKWNAKWNAETKARKDAEEKQAALERDAERWRKFMEYEEGGMIGVYDIQPKDSYGAEVAIVVIDHIEKLVDDGIAYAKEKK